MGSEMCIRDRAFTVFVVVVAVFVVALGVLAVVEIAVFVVGVVAIVVALVVGLFVDVFVAVTIAVVVGEYMADAFVEFVASGDSTHGCGSPAFWNVSVWHGNRHANRVCVWIWRVHVFFGHCRGGVGMLLGVVQLALTVVVVVWVE